MTLTPGSDARRVSYNRPPRARAHVEGSGIKTQDKREGRTVKIERTLSLVRAVQEGTT